MPNCLSIRVPPHHLKNAGQPKAAREKYALARRKTVVNNFCPIAQQEPVNHELSLNGGYCGLHPVVAHRQPTSGISSNDASNAFDPGFCLKLPIKAVVANVAMSVIPNFAPMG